MVRAFTINQVVQVTIVVLALQEDFVIMKQLLKQLQVLTGALLDFGVGLEWIVIQQIY